jgi:hypothetical protein
MTTNDLYWTAGFLGGEGCFTGRYSKCVVKAGQKERWPLDKLERLYGGVVKYRAINGKSGTPIWEWHLSSVRAIGLMMTLYKLLSPKRQDRIRQLLGEWSQRPKLARLRTHCPRGHPYDGDNVKVSTQTGGRFTHRVCRACVRSRWRQQGR